METTTTIDGAIMTPEQVLLWAAEHILSMPGGLIPASSVYGIATAILTFSEWRQLAAASRAIHIHFIRRVVPVVLSQLRRCIDDYVAVYDAPERLLPAGTVVAGPLVLHHAIGRHTQMRAMDLYYPAGSTICAGNWRLGQSVSTGANIYRLRPVRGNSPLDVNIWPATPTESVCEHTGVVCTLHLLHNVLRFRTWVYLVTGDRTGFLVTRLYE